MEFPYIIFNGKLVSKTDSIPISSLLNRGMYYGDGFFDTQFVVGGRYLRNWKFHQKRLIGSFEDLGLEPIEWLIDPSKYQSLVSNLIKKNQTTSNGLSDLVLRIQCWREGGRGYKSESSESSFIIECFKAPDVKDSCSIKSQLINYPIRAGYAPILKSSSAYNYIKIANQNQEKSIVITDSNGNILEGLNASIFWIKGQMLFAPEQVDQVLQGVSKMSLEKLCEDFNLNFMVSSLSNSNILTQEVIFLSNAVQPFCTITKWDQHILPTESDFYQELKTLFYNNIKLHSLDIL